MTDAYSYSYPNAIGAGIRADDVLNACFTGLHGHVEFIALAPRGISVDGPYIRIFDYDLDHDDEFRLWRVFKELNRIGYGIHVAPVTRRIEVGQSVWRTSKTGRQYKTQERGKEQDAWMTRVLWADIDLKDGYYGSKEEIFDRLGEHLGLFEPSIVVDSGGGLQLYWLLRKPLLCESPDDIRAVKMTLRGLAMALHGDTGVSNLSATLRLPRTINTKPEREGHIVEVIDYLGGEYDFFDFDDFRQRGEASTFRPATRDIARPRPDAIPSYAERYLHEGAHEGARNITLNKVAWRLFNDGFSYNDVYDLLYTRACADGMADDEIERTIASAERGKRGTPSWVSRTNVSKMRAGDAIRRRRDRGHS